MSKKISAEEARADIARYEQRLRNPAGLSGQQIEFYKEALRLAREALSNATASAEVKSNAKQVAMPVNERKASTGTPLHLHSTRPVNDARESSPVQGGQGGSRTILAGGFTATEQPITSSIEIAANSDKHNPSITITWSDGYQLTVDETAATSRFKSTFRDCLSLKCVAEGRTVRMWRWDTPWRVAGFYRALIAFWDNKPPTLQDLGISRPSDRQREVFELITQKAMESIKVD